MPLLTRAENPEEELSTDRPLPVELDELAGILEGDPMYGGGRVDLATAERQHGRARAWLADAGYYVRKGLPSS